MKEKQCNLLVETMITYKSECYANYKCTNIPLQNNIQFNDRATGN